jgi:hypothetical protein
MKDSARGPRRPITRRDFMKASACMAAGTVMGLNPSVESSIAETGEKSRVVLVRDLDVLDSKGQVVAEVLERMLDQAVTALTGPTDPTAAWGSLVKPDDVVGIKSNQWRLLPTPPALVSALRKRLMNAGVKDDRIAVDDQGVLRNPLFNNATALINMRPMRTHYWSGLGTLIKNYIMFTPDPSRYHANSCENLGSIWQLPLVKGKTRLNCLVMLTPLFHGAGPHHFAKEYTWEYCGLIVSQDPVAADATGARIIQAKRNVFFGAERPISPPPLHIAAADQKFGLGHSRTENIQLTLIGSDRDLLI